MPRNQREEVNFRFTENNVTYSSSDRIRTRDFALVNFSDKRTTDSEMPIAQLK